MKVKIMIFLLLMFFPTGCANWLEVDKLSPGSEDFLPSEVGLLIPAILKSTDVTENGKEIEPSQEFTRIVLQKIQRTHVFLEVSTSEESGKTKGREKAVKLELSLNAFIDTQKTTNLLKFSVICASLFLLRPVLSLSDDFDLTMILKAIRYDGVERYYKSWLKGTINYRIFGEVQARQEAREEAITKTLNSLMRQVMKDIDFFAMEKMSGPD